MTGTRNFLTAKQSGRKLSLVTCYDYSFAALLAKTDIDAILIGDSAAMVMHGHPSTLFADLPLMEAHTAAVARGAGDKFLIADMPFLSHRRGVADALSAAQGLMRAGAQAVKLEGLDGHEDVVQRLAQSGIPVMGHLGLQPQSVHGYGGYRVQGTCECEAANILRQAKLLEELGAFAVLLECVPAKLAEQITSSLRIPTIGIGAGPGCDGQILVLQDLLGMNVGFHPKFVRTFWDGERSILDALARYDAAVKSGGFPAAEESYQ
jgi:3-methyl-2-oxobutanoate hydroxymethyltransferase